MVSTISLSDVEKNAGNIYEAIVVVAKRALQVNDEQKRYLEQELGYDLPGNESTSNDRNDVEDIQEDNQENSNKFIKLPKPPSVSLDEMISGELEFEYKEKKKS